MSIELQQIIVVSQSRIGKAVMSGKFLTESFARHRDDFVKSSENTRYIVFLCGPSIENVILDPDDEGYNKAAALRKSIKDDLESNGFEVVLGEDDGLEDARLQVGRDAQDNELSYITNYCDAVIIVAGSVGSFCELGLFSWHFTHPDGAMKQGLPEKDFVLLVEEEFQRDRSYFNEGPAKIVAAFGQTQFIDFADFDTASLIDRLRLRKAMIKKDGRGRPRAEG